MDYFIGLILVITLCGCTYAILTKLNVIAEYLKYLTTKEHNVTVQNPAATFAPCQEIIHQELAPHDSVNPK